MMKYGCGCREISNTPIEFKIQECPQVHINCGPLLPNTNDIDWCTLQQKVICDFQKVIKQLECGIQPDIEIILEEISLLFMNSCGYNVAKKMYATDLEEDYFLRHNNFLSEFETQEEKDQVLLNLGIYDKVNALLTRDDVQKMLNTEVNVINSDIDNISDKVDMLNVSKYGYVWTDPNTNICYAFANVNKFESWYFRDNRNESSSLILGKWKLGSGEVAPTPTPTVRDATYYMVSNTEFIGDDISSFQSTTDNTFRFSISNTYFYILTSQTLSEVKTGNNETLYDELQDTDVNQVKQVRTITIDLKTYKVYEFHSAGEFTGTINVTLK